MSYSPTSVPILGASATPFGHRVEVSLEDDEPGFGSASAGAPAPIICFCHLPWAGVWQRPQQLMSRFSRVHRVLFVETYCQDQAESSCELSRDGQYPNVSILKMFLPAHRWAEGDFIDAERRRLLVEFSRNHRRYAAPILWFYDPMSVVAFAGQCSEIAIVYDCMDELAQFLGAPAEMRVREAQLLFRANVVFCGGRKMRERRLALNSNCHFYGTGVDCPHFGTALSAGLKVDPLIAALPGKVLGYFGVIDERIDYALLAHLADANSGWSIAMVGPVTKVRPEDLPQRPNLFWLGRREYADLPAITKGFAVCLMPFALNAATEFINPTKALEYLATGRPVVSTGLDEVKSNFASACHIAESPETFLSLCTEQAWRPDAARIRAGLELAAHSSWESIVDGMQCHVYAAVLERSRRN